MVDVIRKIAESLKGTAPVELSGSEKELQMPCIYLTNISGAPAVTMDNRDFLTAFTYQIDVYAETPKKCVEMAQAVDDIMQQNGWQRSNGVLIGRQRYTLTYKALVSEKYNTYKE
ncbi:MAG: hypothetical protein IJ779_06055 [Ruminococcus sp.]|nr:hypothetical protein [Ruminococcus sp.]